MYCNRKKKKRIVMKRISIKLEKEMVKVNLPDNTEILSTDQAKPLSNPAFFIQKALEDPIGSPSLDKIIEQKLKKNPEAKVVVVISDNTRPVPYKGESGILWPILEKLLAHNIPKERILILVATGTHRPLSEQELREILDPRVFDYKIPIKNHNCRDKNNLTYLGKTNRGSSVYINQDYMAADIKILTDLLEIIGAKKYNHLILSPDWTFVPDQWQAQMWARLFSKIPPENFIYYSPRLSFNDYKIIPCVDGNIFLPGSERYKDNFKNAAQVIEKALEAAIYELKSAGQEKIRIAYLADGPYGVLLKN